MVFQNSTSDQCSTRYPYWANTYRSDQHFTRAPIKQILTHLTNIPPCTSFEWIPEALNTISLDVPYTLIPVKRILRTLNTISLVIPIFLILYYNYNTAHRSDMGSLHKSKRHPVWKIISYDPCEWTKPQFNTHSLHYKEMNSLTYLRHITTSTIKRNQEQSVQVLAI